MTRCSALARSILAVVILLALWSGAAQALDLGRLLGLADGSADGAAQSPIPGAAPATAAPIGAQSLPVAADPTVEQYGALSTQEPMLGAAQTLVALFRSRLMTIIDRIPDAWTELGGTLAAASPSGHGVYFIGIALFACLLLVIGRAVTELYAALVARPIFVSLQRDQPTGYIDKLPVLFIRVLLTVVGITLSLSTASAVGLVFYQDHDGTVLTVVAVFATYALCMLTDTILRVALAPFLPAYRLVQMGDDVARRLYRWLTLVSGFGIVSSAFCYWVLGLGVPREVYVLVTAGLTLVTTILLLLAIRANAGAVSQVIIGGRMRAQTPLLALAAARLWAPGLAIYLAITWADLSFRLVMGIETGPTRLLMPYLTLMAGFSIYAVTIYLIERVFSRQRRIAAVNARAAQRRAAEEAADHALMMSSEMAKTSFGDGMDVDGDGEEEGSAPARPGPAPVIPPRASAVGDPDDAPPPMPAPPPPGRGMRTLEDLARRVASLFAMGVGAYALLRFWGGHEIFDQVAAFGIAEDLIDVLLVGYIAFHAVRIWIDQKIDEEGGDMDLAPGDEGGATGVSRLATLLPLFRNFILIVIAVTVGIILATRIGLNVAPLFAGAGIVGLAIGFGAQTLVRDILSGAFFLLDDAFRKGEYIDVGQVKGTVEKISLRSFQLRHHLGMLHTIPFGEIQHLTNFSRDWVIMKLPLRLTYDTDVDKVRRVIKKLGQMLLEDPEIGDRFLQPLKSQGVIMMEDSAMIIRVKFMTRPGDQWVVRKRVFQDIRTIFEKEGITFAHREVTVRIPGLPTDRPLTPDELNAAGAAARTAIDQADLDALPPRGTGTNGPMDDR